MGNGLIRRYKPEDGYDHNAWRKPKAKPKKKSDTSATKDKATPDENAHGQWRQPKPREAPSAGSTTGSSVSSTTAGGSSGAQSVVNWTMASAMREPVPQLGVEEDEADDDDCANLADAAAKVWEDLMCKREATKDFGALFYLGELKDGVERAVKRVEVMRREVSAASAKAEEKEKALTDLCNRIEEKLLPNANFPGQQWKLGDMAIRRGKGLCELSVVHHEADPPYYEVRMVVTGSVVGTEASNLLELPPQQKSLVRNSLRELEQAKAKLSPVEESLLQAQEELKKQHLALTDQVEKKLRDNSALSASPHTQQPAAGGAPPALGNRLAPPGLPELNLIKRWAAKPQGEAVSPTPSAPEYPDMRGLREDMRLPGNPDETTPQPTPTRVPGGGGMMGGAASAGSVPQFGSSVPTPNAPVGFPSLDELNRMEEQAAAERDRQQAAAAAGSYPTVHPSAAREVFSRPGAAEATTGPQAKRWSPGSVPPQHATPDPGPVPRTSSKSSKDTGIPAGFPRLDPNFAAGQDNSGPSPQQRQAHAQSYQQPQQRPAAQQQQQSPYQQPYQQPHQQPYQQPGPAAGQPGQAAAEWVMYRTAEGCPYYHNERTNETAWQLPVGARCRDPAAAATSSHGPSMWQQQEQQAQADEDPFADLRKREEEMRQQREQWASWYAQYCQWYTSTAQAQAQAQANAQAAGAGAHSAGGAGIPAGSPPPHGGHKQQAPPHFGTDPGQGVKLPPRGPQPPKLDASFEDHATYALKSSVLKEMEAMVAKGAPLAQRKKALRCLHLRWHPDKNPDKLEVAKSVFQFIEETKPWFLHDPEAEESGVT